MTDILPGLPGSKVPYVRQPARLSGRLLLPAHVAERLTPDNPLGDYIRAVYAQRWGLPR